jgi:hypothetical protein
MASADRPPMRHNEGPMKRLIRVWCPLLMLVTATGASAQQIDSGSIFRIFLKDGVGLPSYGDYAVVGDRLVFTLAVGRDVSHLQLMSLPAASVDLERTARYATSVRAAHYARTRGEADYLAMTAEVTQALDHLARVPDPATRLALAEEAKRRLLKWSRDNYSYRASDIRQLAGLFDEVIAELRLAAGAPAISLEFSTAPIVPDLEPLWPAPDYPETLALILAAVGAADLPEERRGILQAALQALSDEPRHAGVRAVLARELETETAADAAYATLAADLLARAEKAMQKGDVRGISALEPELATRDEALGYRRGSLVSTLSSQLRAMIDRAAAYRLALDHYALVRRDLLRYERRVRPIMSGLDALKPLLTHVRDLQGSEYSQLEQAEAKLIRFRTQLESLTPPDELATIHATLTSALRMAETACARRRLAVATTSLTAAKEASAAAGGALLLSAAVRQDLVALLFPPRLDAVR